MSGYRNGQLAVCAACSEPIEFDIRWRAWRSLASETSHYGWPCAKAPVATNPRHIPAPGTVQP